MRWVLLVKLLILGIGFFLTHRFLLIAGVIRPVKHEKLGEESLKKKLQQERLVKQQKQALALLSWAGKKVNKDTYSYEAFEKSAQRLDIELFGTHLTGVQLRGLISLMGISALFLGVVWTLVFGFSIINALLFGFGLISLVGYQAIMDTIVVKKDKRLDEAFSDLYLMVYTSIVDETGTPLIKCLNTFMKANEYKLYKFEGEDLKRVKEIMKFANDYATLLTKLPESTATREIRKKYGTSALIINFCTIVEQRLRGKDNRDKLIAFKQELLNKKIRLLEAKSQKLISRGELITNLIYIILIEVIIVSALSGLPLERMLNR